jgi:DNA-binding transcriptional LysR family regulator
MLIVVDDVDLNLLRTLRVILEEESVSRASTRLYQSVAATSRALARCRLLFGDPLLVRRGRGLVMTPRAESLLVELNDVFGRISDALARPAHFDPSEIDERFVIRANDAVLAVLVLPLLEHLASSAPRASIQFEVEGGDDLDRLRSGRCSLAIGSYGDDRRELSTEALVTVERVGVVRAGHPVLRRRMTEEVFASLGHVVTSRRGRGRSLIDEQLAAADLRRNVVAVVPSFSVALVLCGQSNLTTIAPANLADSWIELGVLARYRAPVDLPPVRVEQLWHHRLDADPAHRWLRTQIRAIAEST